jgi:dihydroneopterin aldolase
MDKITLSRMAFYGNHGVFPEENKLGQRYFADVELVLPLSESGRSDNLADTINYVEVYEIIENLMERKTFKLIEALAENIASELLRNYTKVEEITVRVTKPNPPFKIFFDGVTVEIHRKRA